MWLSIRAAVGQEESSYGVESLSFLPRAEDCCQTNSLAALLGGSGGSQRLILSYFSVSTDDRHQGQGIC